MDNIEKRLQEIEQAQHFYKDVIDKLIQSVLVIQENISLLSNVIANEFGQIDPLTSGNCADGDCPDKHDIDFLFEQ